MKLLKFLFFLKVALLPGLATIGYFVAQGGPDWMEIMEMEDEDAQMLLFLWGMSSAVLMLFVSILYFMKLRKIKSPKGFLPLLIAIVQAPVMLYVMHAYFGVEMNFWKGSMSALLIEMNGLLLAILFLTYVVKRDNLGIEEGVLFLFVAPTLGLNLSVYGWHIWEDLFQQNFLYQLPFYFSILLDAYFFIKADLDGKPDEEEAYNVLGRELSSAVVLVPTWGMLLLVHPIWPFIKHLF